MVKYSIIIPIYNEELVIEGCLASLAKQTVAKNMEIIVVDDGSTDKTLFTIENCKLEIENFMVLHQNHGGPGTARNLGSSKAKGEILVFVDADMEFAPDFIEKLTAPILSGKTIGTYSTEELLLNSSDPWAVCWNLNFSGHKEKLSTTRRVNIIVTAYHLIKKFLEAAEIIIAPISHRNITPLSSGGSKLPYRAILKSEFLKVGGFSLNVGYTDDWSLAEKLNLLPTPVSAKYYHRNPSSLSEIWRQARWIGRDELKTGNIVRQLYYLITYNPISSVIIGLFGVYRHRVPRFFVFKIVYNTAVFTSVLLSFFNEKKYK